MLIKLSFVFGVDSTVDLLHSEHCKLILVVVVLVFLIGSSYPY